MPAIVSLEDLRAYQKMPYYKSLFLTIFETFYRVAIDGPTSSYPV